MRSVIILPAPNHDPEMDELKYPVGKHSFDAAVEGEEYPELIEIIAAAPAVLRKALSGLSDSQLDTPYREGGWTVRQVVHHMADSHMNAYCRVKLALTEKEPRIKTYVEAAWAELPDSRAPVEVSLRLLESVHDRWVRIWRSLSESDLRQRRFIHPDYASPIRLEQALSMYAWHCRHHTAHITRLRERQGWNQK